MFVNDVVTVSLFVLEINSVSQVTLETEQLLDPVTTFCRSAIFL